MSTAAERAFLGISHTPLLGIAPLPSQIDEALHGALAEVRRQVLDWRPELVVLIGPDHYNGFVHELMPAFCIGSHAMAVGDYRTPAGSLNVDAKAALELAAYLIEHRFDAAVSRHMQVDHGFAQPLQLLWNGLDTPPIVPIFMNAVGQPAVMRVPRCRELGEAIGGFLDSLGRRTLVIGSGGLSHDPPVPTIEHPDAEVRKRITFKRTATQAEHDARVQRAMTAGQELAEGRSTLQPLNSAWDLRWMDALASGRLATLDALSEDDITREAGRSGHESKTWLAGRAALGTSPAQCTFRWHRAIPELIAGYGLLLMHAGAG